MFPLLPGCMYGGNARDGCMYGGDARENSILSRIRSSIWKEMYCYANNLRLITNREK